MKRIYFIIFSISLMSNCFAQQDDTILQEIHAIENSLIKNIQVEGEPIQKFNIAERMEYYKVPGVSIALVENGKIKWAKGYGYANTKTGTKVDENTLFQAGSISKPVAALSALKLMENGRLELDKDVNKYLVDWQIPENSFTETNKVTLEMLLTHTAGMTVHGFPGYKQSDEFPAVIDVLNGKGNTSKIEVDTVPGSIWRYSGGGYTVMQKIVADVSGTSFNEYTTQNILLPIGMKNSTYQQPVGKEFQKNISAAYDNNGDIIEGLWHNYPELAAAGLWTTPSDLALYCIEMQDIIQGKKEGVLSKESVGKMLSKHKNDWGLGPSLKNEGDSLRFQHGGKNAGFTNDLVAFAYQGNAVIIMTNADNGGKLISEIENAVSDYYNWNISKPRTIEVISLPDADLKKFTGKYKLEGQKFYVKVQFDDKHIFIEDTELGNLTLLPLTATKFIDMDSGAEIEFMVDKKVSGFVFSNRFKFVKKR